MLPRKMSQQDHMQAVLKDTIVLLCQNGLQFQSEFNVEALVAITVDQSEVVLVSIKETIHANNILDEHPALSAVDQEERVLDAAIKQELSSTTPECAESEMDVSIRLESENSSDVLSDRTERPIEKCQDMHNTHVLQTLDVCSKPNTSSADNSARRNLLSPSLDESARLSDEAVDLSYVRMSPVTKRKRLISNSAHSSKEVGLSGLGDASVNDIDSNSESSSIICIKDEVPSAADISTVITSIPLDGKGRSKHSYGKASNLLDNTGSSCLVAEDATNTTTNQVINDVDIQLICQALISYSGWCVPLRDIQRLRLRGIPSVTIRTAMETLERTGLGRYLEVTGNTCIFYKCPPHLVSNEALSRWHLTWNEYSLQFKSLPAVNQTNRHNESYWHRVASCSPYTYL